MVISQETLTWSWYFLQLTVKEQEGYDRERGDKTSLGSKHDRNFDKSVKGVENKL